MVDSSCLSKNGKEPLAYRVSIDDAGTWAELASYPKNFHVARTSVVKFIIDKQGEKEKLYFLYSPHYEDHYEFIINELSDALSDPYDFYRRIYREDDRPYVVGSLVYYEDADAWTFQFISGDILSAELILDTLQFLKKSTYFGSEIYFRPTSDIHFLRTKELGKRLPVMTDGELYGAIQYQPIQLGVAYGTLRVHRGRIDRAQLTMGDIVVTDEVPDDLPLCAALITSRFQAPLAHVAILSANRGTPDMALRGAFEHDTICQLDGRLVRLEVDAQDYNIAEVTAEEVLNFTLKVKKENTIVPRVDLKEKALLLQNNLGFGDVHVAGAKAANIGALSKLRRQGVNIPEGFVIPFSHYSQHLSGNGISQLISSLLLDQEYKKDPTSMLLEIQKAIKSADTNQGLLADISREIRSLTSSGNVVLRSSTNVEDLPGFNGAGLYSSVVLAADAGYDEIASGVQYIWASVWNLRAFQEREYYKIDHTKVAMAVLVQLAVDNSAASGVALTQNPYDPDRSKGVLINIQWPEASVTSAEGDQIPEQWLVYTYLPTRDPELLANSNLNQGSQILRGEEVLEFTQQLELIHKEFAPQLKNGCNAVDVEMVLDKARKFFVVQARPHRVVWSGREGVRA